MEGRRHHHGLIPSPPTTPHHGYCSTLALRVHFHLSTFNFSPSGALFKKGTWSPGNLASFLPEATAPSCILHFASCISYLPSHYGEGSGVGLLPLAHVPCRAPGLLGTRKTPPPQPATALTPKDIARSAGVVFWRGSAARRSITYSTQLSVLTECRCTRLYVIHMLFICDSANITDRWAIFSLEV